MRRFLIISLMLVLLPAALHAADKKPFILLFPVVSGEGASEKLAAETTLAIKTYLRQTGRADVADFDPESVIIVRAIEENRIQSSDLVGNNTPEVRMKLGQLLGVPMVASGDVTDKEGKISVGLWMGNAQNKKVWRSSVAVEIASGGDRARAASNALQSAVSTLTWQLVGDALKDVKPDSLPTDVQPAETPEPKVEELDPAQPADNSAATLNRAVQFEKSGDIANAVLEYRKAINADPRNIDIRLKLSQLYTKRKMYPQAIDELERAQKFAPSNENIQSELARIYEERGTPEKAATVYVTQAERNPSDIKTRLSAGDYYLKQSLYEQAEQQYKLAVQTAPNSPVPHERLAELYASQSKFDECTAEVVLLQKLAPKDDQKTVADRYSRFTTYTDHGLVKLMDQFDSNARDFADRKMIREDYYVKIRQIGIQMDPIAKLLDTLVPPEAAMASHNHRILGCNLISQASSHMLRYLETNKSSESSSASICIAEARKHFAKASGS